MNQLRNILFAVIAATLFSCSGYVIAPSYTNVEKITSLKPGMTLEQVNQTLGNKPYDFYYGEDEGTTVVTYRYRRLNRRKKIDAAEFFTWIHTPVSQTDGETWYDDKGIAEIKVRFMEGKFVSLISNEGMKYSYSTVLTDNDIRFIDDNEVSYIEQLYAAAQKAAERAARKAEQNKAFDTVYAINIANPADIDDEEPIEVIQKESYIPEGTEIRNGKALLPANGHRRLNIGLALASADPEAVEYDPDITVDNSTGFGLEFINYSSRFGIGYNFYFQRYTVSEDGFEIEGNLGTNHVNLLQRLFVSGIYDPTGTKSRVNPYAKLGFQLGIDEYILNDSEGEESGIYGGVYFQVGSYVKLTDNFQAFAEVGTGGTTFTLGVSFRRTKYKWTPVEQFR